MNQIYISPNDPKKYKVVKLENQLEVLLISDTATTMSGASLIVNIGSFQEQKMGIYGLAHFLEHMLFMGSKKYPKENAFFEYIMGHGGYTNAFTTNRHTCYFFNINTIQFEQALDIFVQFFIDPLMSQSSVSKEINAIQSEYDKNKGIDDMRLRYILKLLTREEHPFHNFDIGSKEIFENCPIHTKLLEFYNTYYSANLMKLLIMDNKPIDVMEQYVNKLFGQIKNNNVTISDTYGDLFSKRHYVEIIPSLNHNTVTLCWNIPYNYNHKMYRPINFLNYILGRESKGSLYVFLKENTLIKKLNATIIENCGDHLLYTIYIHLTKKGLDMVDDIINIILQYIVYISQNIVVKDVYDYLFEFKKYNYLYPTQLHMNEYLTYLTHNMIDFGATIYETVNYDLIMNKYDKSIDKIIGEYLDMLNVQRMNVILCSQKFRNVALEIEPWIQTKYNIIDDDTYQYKLSSPVVVDVKKIHQSIFEYDLLPQTLEIHKPITPNIPIEIIPNSHIWGNSSAIIEPKLCINITITIPHICQSINTYIMYQIMTIIIMDHVNTEIYDAIIIGYDVNIKLVNDTLMMELYGFDDKIDIILSKIIYCISNTQFTKEEFDKAKNSYMMDLYRDVSTSPHERLLQYIRECMYVNTFTLFDQLKSITNISYDDVNRLNIHYGGYVKCLINGNISISKYEKIHKLLRMLVDINISFQDTLVNWKIIDVAGGTIITNKLRSPNTTNHNSLSAVQVCYAKITMNDVESQKIFCMGTLMKIILMEPFFNQLRTQQQLGYITRSSIMKLGHPSQYLMTYLFYIQSATHNPKELKKEILNFIDNSKHIIGKMTNNEFKKYLDAGISLLSYQPTNLCDQSNELFICIEANNFIFNYKKQLIETMKKITKRELEEFHNTYFINVDTRQICIYNIYKHTTT